jgi:membrane protein implicated in regulation of membrane protease activity
MNWAEFYLVCFFFGFGLSVLSFLGGSAHLHLPHLHLHHGTHMGRGGSSWFNLATVAAFLAWFGGTGYLLEHYYGVWFVLALGISIVSGIGASAVVFWFLARVLLRHEAPLNPADYDMTGVLGRLSLPIRCGGTGELIYSQEGTRRVAGARSEDGSAIPKGAEVVVTRYEKGIAYVKLWDDFVASIAGPSETNLK